MKSASVITDGWEITGEHALPVLIGPAISRPDDESQVVALQSGTKKPCELLGRQICRHYVTIVTTPSVTPSLW
jgi:hypothetical protein